MQAKSDGMADSMTPGPPEAVDFSEIRSLTIENYLKNLP
jgi:hypothetical protein